MSVHLQEAAEVKSDLQISMIVGDNWQADFPRLNVPVGLMQFCLAVNHK